MVALLHPVPDSSRSQWRRWQVGAHGRLPDERDLLRRQQPEVRPPLVLELERTPTIAVPVAADGVPDA